MARTLCLSRDQLAILIALVIVTAVIAIVEFVPQCSIFMQKLTSIAARVTGDSSLATAAECTQSSNGKEVYFVSCGGFF